jgi:hypothetical protein
MPNKYKQTTEQTAPPAPTTVLCQIWQESERGWGTRPDGYSLHVSQEALIEYVDQYWKRMPDEPPDEYSSPAGAPYLVKVDPTTAKAVARTQNLRVFNNTYPPKA